ncbi:hypothetical protein COS81_03070 [candidate division WWE3 bacterium CG06_land_8_20_14_3_00_42_16]|uniref:Uncharacterized protein n=4 Tax=Katanobacteria TaxID=422282 RepID=A0A2M7AML0_UNCKA|nr:MAG: hypothetical protein AUJ38_00835 [bacterium CG1_02_42_9]PIU68632.1 MAG: hypothetical protein COS81_03070 [candidate division WWE3 bacterium CG06_land_8_20_14_3_00_42_16]PIZ43012.1 MAG: hypothetical protein COY34_01805 [candidate division WWE3 bacterium CG_4_10_14_0_2_um_filter_42_8]PJA37962.1 MAG: hypothetical protein CO181_01560 [candidate division WWE3 bacterium CG_4_9_14_3_um_filter_43_9]PJC69354.1 MAG: hypothetical protein CO015_00520 [candidate division WWE3 bacterium CG_4_8_14_3_u
MVKCGISIEDKSNKILVGSASIKLQIKEVEYSPNYNLFLKDFLQKFVRAEDFLNLRNGSNWV